MSKTETVTETIPGELIYYFRQLSPELTEVEIVPFADAHYGNPLFSLPHLIKFRDYVQAQPNRYVICVGDLCESVVMGSKGDIYKQSITPETQRDFMIEFLTPIKDRILGMVTGNHEARIYNLTGIDISKDIAKALNVPYRAEGILLKVSLGTYRSTSGRHYTYFIYANHGYGGARTKSAKAVKVERLATYLHADCYCMGHDHAVNVAPDVYLVPDPRTTYNKDTGFTTGKVIAHSKMLVKLNSYIKWGAYSEMGGFSPVNLQFPVIKLMGHGVKEIKVLVSSG